MIERLLLERDQLYLMNTSACESENVTKMHVHLKELNMVVCNASFKMAYCYNHNKCMELLV